MGPAHVPLVRLGRGIACPGCRICEQQILCPEIIKLGNLYTVGPEVEGALLLVQGKRRDGRGLPVKCTGQSFLKR